MIVSYSMRTFRQYASYYSCVPYINGHFRMYHLHIQRVQNKYYTRVSVTIITDRIKSNTYGEKTEYLMNTRIGLDVDFDDIVIV